MWFLKTNFILLILLLFVSSCSYDFKKTNKVDEYLDAPVDFSKFYVLGDRTVSGFMDGALYKGGQEYSPAALIGSKLDSIYEQKVFRQPQVNSEQGYNPEASASVGEIMGKFRLNYPEINSLYLQRLAVDGEPLSEWTGSVDDIHDFSIPGMKSYELQDDLKLQENIYYSRLPFDSDGLIESLIESEPEVVLLSIGSDDILEYAMAGASGDEDPDLNNISSIDLTPSNIYEASVNTVVDRIIDETDAHIFIMNIHNPLESPFFKTLDIVVEPRMFSRSFISYLGDYYQEFNDNVFQYNYIEGGGVPHEEHRPIIDFDPTVYPNLTPRTGGRVIYDEYLPHVELDDGTIIPKWRQMDEGEYVLYKLEGEMTESTGLSTEIPMSDDQVLTLPEIEIIEKRISEYNKIIDDLALNDRIHLVDVKKLFDEIKNEEYLYEGVRYNLRFDRRGIYSADGYSFNPRGNAILANQVINSINQTFDTRLKSINPNHLRGTVYTSSFD